MNLNLHWGRTLQNKAVQLRHRSQYNISNLGFNYSNYSDYKLSDGSALYPWKVNYTGSGNGNGSILHAENQFLKKSKILTDLIGNTGKSTFVTIVTNNDLFNSKTDIF